MIAILWVFLIRVVIQIKTRKDLTSKRILLTQVKVICFPVGKPLAIKSYLDPKKKIVFSLLYSVYLRLK